MRFLSAPTTASLPASPRRHLSGFTLLETLVALAVLLTLTMVVASIYKHHTSAPAAPTQAQEQEQTDLEPRHRNLSPSEMPSLRDPADTPAPSGR
jgi:prepilin-type N-terminal cleavage/methylation domain-containing protein